MAALSLRYLIRLLLPRQSNNGWRLGRIRLPSTFDPAPLVYPSLLPGLIALSVSTQRTDAVLPNIVLGLSTLPQALIPSFRMNDSYDTCHWLMTLMPLMINERHTTTSTMTRPTTALDAETIALLFPLHQALLPILHFLTTSSLLNTELQLLSVGLTNVLILSTTPQASILPSFFWVGGLSILVLCNKALRRNVALERIPTGPLPRARRAFSVGPASVADLQMEHDRPGMKGFTDYTRPHHLSNGEVQPKQAMNNFTPNYVSRPPRRTNSTSPGDVANAQAVRPRTFDDAGTDLRRVRTVPVQVNGTRTKDSLLQIQQSEAFNSSDDELTRAKRIYTHKILYTVYTYMALVVVIVGPVRYTIGRALRGWEPIGWAIGYLLGDLPFIKALITDLELWSWIPPTNTTAVSAEALHALGSAGWVDQYRFAYGPSNVRLLLFAYWALVIALGLFTVLRLLSEFAETDTRRKVFHGMMVVMLLPTTFIDPCFLALGLGMVLAIFLLLEIIRAGQLRPLARPLARFITPYIDGRDLRGPVVVSHVFLLIGCAIPLWLSLARYGRSDESASHGASGKGDPWAGWELVSETGPDRDLSMVAGVVCVGLGDSAASLVGRRYGKHKWPWAGGKSLEGSGAFVIAVTVGLLVAKCWLQLGGWQSLDWSIINWSKAVLKMVCAASGASFTEAVLTGANDNVVVPIVLFLLVRGLSI